MAGAPFDWKAYIIAALLVGAAGLLRLGLALYDPHIVYFATFFPAVLLTALWGGPAPAIFATALSVLIAWFALLPPAFSFALEDRTSLVNLGMFIVSSALIIWIAERHRQALLKIAEGERLRQLLVEEMRHRNRNSLTVARSLILRTLSHDPATAENLSARLRSVLDTDNVLAGGSPAGELLHRLLLVELQPYGTDRFGLFGKPIMLPPKHARNLALVFHELATNALKYGALAAPDGFLAISWNLDGDVLHIHWTEKTLLEPSPQPAKRGFGTQLIDAMVRDLGGKVARSISSNGFSCSIEVPLRTHPEAD